MATSDCTAEKVLETNGRLHGKRFQPRVGYMASVGPTLCAATFPVLAGSVLASLDTGW